MVALERLAAALAADLAGEQPFHPAHENIEPARLRRRGDLTVVERLGTDCGRPDHRPAGLAPPRGGAGRGADSSGRTAAVRAITGRQMTSSAWASAAHNPNANPRPPTHFFRMAAPSFGRVPGARGHHPGARAEHALLLFDWTDKGRA